MRYNENGECMTEHHVKYKEIHGIDETVWMTRGEHIKLHGRLRRDGECQVDIEELGKISRAANTRTSKFRAQRKEEYQENREIVSAQRKKYYQDNKEKIQLRHKKYDEEHPGERKKYMKEYYLRNKLEKEGI